MNKPRLEKLIVALTGVNRESFSMKDYGHNCGTPSCVLGHYAHRRDLQRTFKLNENGWVDDGDGEIDMPDCESVTTHFGITSGQAFDMFNGYGCGNAQTPKQAQRYIRKFIDTNGEMK